MRLICRSGYLYTHVSDKQALVIIALIVMFLSDMSMVSANSDKYSRTEANTSEPNISLLTPPTADGPVLVTAQFKLNDINEIYNSSETFEFSGILTLKWTDPRQAFDPIVEGMNEKIFQGNYQFNELATGWYPQVMLVNESGWYQKNGVLMRVQPDGSSTLIEAVYGVAESEMNMNLFPFDKHSLEIIFSVLGFDKNEVLLKVKSDNAGPMAHKVRIPQWSVMGMQATVRDQKAFHTGSSGVSSTFVFSVDVERKSLYIIRLIVFPLIVIVLLSFSVFWMDHQLMGDRLNISFIGILTGVAYLIVASDELPHISYITVLHGFLNLSFVIMCSTVVINLMVGEHEKKGEYELGDRIDERCRWGFPLMYFGVLLIMFGVAALVF